MQIGTDIINVNEMPDYYKPSEKRFFHDNFSKSEIEYIMNRKNFKELFAVTFSIKESLAKCDNSLTRLPFNRLEILFKKGIPYFDNYKIDYSKAKNIIITIAIKS